jgi:heme/copper-type cytochrome/quinol oxidase subunit 1
MWVIGAGLALTGLAMATVGLLTPVSFGWFAYQPLAAEGLSQIDNAVIISHTTVAGFLLLGIGLVVLAFLLGRRSRGKHDVVSR